MKKYVPLAVASIFYIAIIIFYSYHLGWISEDPSRWGEFGDFIGGVINPTIGLITIWLLVNTLKQEKTSHDEQVKLNEEKNDFETCMDLIRFYEEKKLQVSYSIAKEEERYLKITEFNRSAITNQQDLLSSNQVLFNNLLAHRKNSNIEMEALQDRIRVLSKILEKRFNYLIDEYGDKIQA